MRSWLGHVAFAPHSHAMLQAASAETKSYEDQQKIADMTANSTNSFLTALLGSLLLAAATQLAEYLF
jgi:hypothetical protein